jgi:hypothetical protein
MRKVISLLLVFFIFLLSGNMFAKERKGADLIIRKIDGTQVRGELIAVKEKSLLLVERNSGVDYSININEIKTARIHKNSLLPVTIGLTSGIAVGMGVGYAIEQAEVFATTGFNMNWGPFFLAMTIASIGLIIGVLMGTDDTFQFEGMSKSEIQMILEKLSKKARIKNAQ